MSPSGIQGLMKTTGTQPTSAELIETSLLYTEPLAPPQHFEPPLPSSGESFASGLLPFLVVQPRPSLILASGPQPRMKLLSSHPHTPLLSPLPSIHCLSMVSGSVSTKCHCTPSDPVLPSAFFVFMNKKEDQYPNPESFETLVFTPS